ncbi:MAG: flagellar hook-basal body complex protein FliE [Proteobacteria bacterium]|nr:flagellar hook-basal body complex protein FliE [Pseudomonadota bacterium]
MPMTAAQNITKVLNAYNEAAKGRPQGIESDKSTKGNEFADLVKGAISEAKKIGEHSEQLSIAGIAGRADIGQVVAAVAEAEVVIQTVVAIRDKVIDAYKQIIRMPM